MSDFGEAITLKNTLRKNFAWAVAANLLSQASKWAYLLLIARVLGQESAGQFAAAAAIVAPIGVAVGMNLRMRCVIDQANRFRWSDYVGLQVILLPILIILPAVIVRRASSETVLITFVYSAYQAIVLLKELVIGWHQKGERMDRVARTRALQAVGSIAFLAITISVTDSIVLSVASLLLSTALVFAYVDLPVLLRGSVGAVSVPGGKARQWRLLLCSSLPLALASAANAVQMNVPKTVLSQVVGDLELGRLAPVLALPMIGKIVVQGAVISALPRLTRGYENGDRARHRLLLLLLAGATAAGVIGLLVAYSLGESLLGVLLGSAYVSETEMLEWSMWLGGLMYIAAVLNACIASMNRFWYNMVVNSGSAVVAYMAALKYVPVSGGVGAIKALMFAVGAKILASLCMIAKLELAKRFTGAKEKVG